MITRKRSNGRATYQKIIDAAVKIMREEGPSQVTTTRLAEASGIVQSGFYTHFSRVDEALEVAAEQIGQHLRQIVQGWLDEIIELNGGTIGQLAQHYERIFRLLLKDRYFTELFLRYRRAPSALGQVLRRFEHDILGDVTAQLARLRSTTDPQPQPGDQHQAEQIMRIFWGLTDGVLYGEEGEKRIPEVALQLSVLTKAVVELMRESRVDTSSFAVLSPDLFRVE